MSTIRVRRLDENWDPVYGNGQNDYLTDLDALLQILKSRMKLWKGEWWEDLTDGLPMLQYMLGKYQQKGKITADGYIQSRILNTKYVNRIVSFQSKFDSSTRSYQCLAVIDTDFGQVTLTNGG